MKPARVKPSSVRPILVVGFLAFAGTGLARAQEDVPGSKDHPLVARYPGSRITSYVQKELDEFQLPLARFQDVAPAKTHPLEGKVTQILYENPENRSVLEIHRSYEASLRSAGFQVLFSCGNLAQCGGGGYFEGLSGHGEWWNDANPVRHLSAKLSRPAGDVYVSLHVQEGQYGTWLDVVETRRLPEFKPRATPTVQAATLCEAVDCSAASASKPTITEAVGLVGPGHYITVRGSRFGHAAGQVLVRLLKSGGYYEFRSVDDPYRRWPNATYGSWSDTMIVAQMVPDIRGHPDQPAELLVLTKQGEESGAFPVSFRADREYISITAGHVQVVSCSRAASHNDCRGRQDRVVNPSSVFATHSEDLLGHGGTDIYSVRVTNGWAVTGPTFRANSFFDIFGGTWAAVNEGPMSYPPPDSWTATVNWSTGLFGNLMYWLDIDIVGPAGVPYW